MENGFNGENFGAFVAKQHEMEIREKMMAIEKQTEREKGELEESLKRDKENDGNQNNSDSREVLQKEIYDGPLFENPASNDEAFSELNNILDSVSLTYSERRFIEKLSSISKILKDVSNELHELNKHQCETARQLHEIARKLK